MKIIRKTAALVLALALLCSAALADPWVAEKKNIPVFQSMFNRMKQSIAEPRKSDRAAVDAKVKEIRKRSEADGNVAQAIAEHWFTNVKDENYPMYVYRGGDTAAELEASGLDFSGRHAFVVLGFRLENGEITEELAGRCRAAAAAARSWPDAILVCTGGVTGPNNPDLHSEAGEMKKYLTETCGIEAERIFTDPESMTTGANAVNTITILQEQGIETFTLVTSDYHQLWAQVLFNGVAAMAEQETGQPIRLTGNYNFPAQPKTARTAYCATGVNQLRTLIREQAGLKP